MSKTFATLELDFYFTLFELHNEQLFKVINEEHFLNYIFTTKIFMYIFSKATYV